MAADSLDYEILGFLRRCLTQQAQIRKSLYEGLTDLYHHKNHLGDVIFDLLLNQFLTYYEQEESIPFKLDKCTATVGETVKLIEPFPFLLFCVQKSVIAHARSLDKPLNMIPSKGDTADDDNEENQKSFDKLACYLRKFIAKLTKCTLTDFELDEKADFSLPENKALAEILLSVYEVSFEFVLLSADSSELPRAFDVLYLLFEKYLRLKLLSKQTSTAKSKAKGKGRKLNSGETLVVDKPLLSLEFPYLYLKTLYTPGQIDEANHDICGSDSFDAYLIDLLHEQLSRFDGEVDQYFFQDLAFFIMRSITTFRMKQPDNGPKSKRERSPLFVCVQCFELSFRIACKDKSIEECAEYLSTALKQEIKELGIEEHGESEKQLHTRVTIIELMISNLITNEHAREAEILTNMLSTLTSYLPPDLTLEHIDWVEKLCTEEVIEHPGLAKALISHALQLCFEADDVKKIKEYACDLHSILGDCASNSISGTVAHNIVNAQTTIVLAQELLSTMDKILENCEWKLQEIQNLAQASKTRLLVDQDSIANEELMEKRLNLEQDLYVRTRRYIVMFCELVQAQTSGSVSEAVMRMAARLYKFLIAIVKLSLSVKQKPTTQLMRLVDCTIEMLTQSTHFLIKSFNEKSESAATIGRQARLIPNLIYNMEHFERYIIKLSNQSKVDLTTKMTRNTARDFQIRIKPSTHSQSETEASQRSTRKRGRSQSQSQAGSQPSKRRKH